MNDHGEVSFYDVADRREYDMVVSSGDQYVHLVGGSDLMWLTPHQACALAAVLTRAADHLDPSEVVAG